MLKSPTAFVALVGAAALCVGSARAAQAPQGFASATSPVASRPSRPPSTLRRTATRSRIGAGTFAGGITIDKSVSLVGMSAGATTIEGGGPVITIGDGTANPTVSIGR